MSDLRAKSTFATASRRLAALLASAAVVASAGCGGTDSPAGVAGAPDYERALADAPPKLAALYAHGDAVLGGGTEAFRRQLDELRGHPVVVNKWASWCGPCREEFPFFQQEAAARGDRIAFLGVNSNDAEAAAETFLRDHPVPYPSFSDPDEEINAEFLDNSRQFPSTAFYDSEGKLAYVRLGGYATRDDLAADIERYAR